MSRMRRYWQGLVIAAAVSYGQLQDSTFTDVRAAQKHPYVWLMPDGPAGWNPLERIGDRILTTPLEAERSRQLN